MKAVEQHNLKGGKTGITITEYGKLLLKFATETNERGKLRKQER